MTTSKIPPLDTYSLKQAAEVAGVSVSTMRRRKEALISAGATVSDRGWKIPATALAQVFEVSGNTAPDTPSDTPIDSQADSPLVAQLQSEIAFLRTQVEQQARTIERQAEAHAVVAGQLAKLELEPVSPVTVSEPEPERRRWWQRAR